MKTKIIFNKNSNDNFHYRKLRERIKNILKELPEKRKLNKVYIALALPIVYLVIYLLAISNINQTVLYYSLFALLGIISVLIFINIIHEAVHNNVFKKKWANNIYLIVFDLIGGNSFIWKKRHMLLHHNYQNIAGWDSDIEQSGLIKIFPHEESSVINRNQHWLIFLFYPLYLFNWILIRDFKDFFLKNRLIKKVCKIPVLEYIKLFFFKFTFIFYMVIIPVIIGVNLNVAIVALCIMLISGGSFALLILLTPHINVKNQFPLPNADGELNVSWFEHQFVTTNDISLNNWVTRNIMGNFNFHLSHHLFPRISSVYAPEVTEAIREYANENGFGYRSYKLKQALRYHYKLIKANALEDNFFEEDM